MLRRFYGLLLIVTSCQSTGGQIAGKIGSAVADAASHGGSGAPEHERWSSGRGRCDVFGDYQLACPVLPSCEGLYRSRDGVTTNVCDGGSGVLKPITTCTGWGGDVHWCSAGSFPRCDRWRDSACGEFESMICEDDDGRKRVLRCCGAEEQNDECRANAYYEPRRRETEPEQTGASSPSS